MHASSQRPGVGVERHGEVDLSGLLPEQSDQSGSNVARDLPSQRPDAPHEACARAGRPPLGQPARVHGSTRGAGLAR